MASAGSKRESPDAKEPAASGNGHEAPAPRESTLNLTRYFSIASLAGVILVMGVLVFFYRQFTLSALEEHETRDNSSIAQVFASTLWPRHAEFVKGASTIPRPALRERAELKRIREDVLHLMKGLTVVKVKIYNLDGLTVFSSDPSQIGEDKSTNGGFQKAKAGTTVSEITFRDRFDAFEQVISDRNLVSSYAPIRASQHAPVEGVMEVYSDVTPYVEKLAETTWKIVIVVLGSLSLLYLFLLTIVRRAERTIVEQQMKVLAANEALLYYSKTHDTLTGLPNRSSFAERLQRILDATDRGGGQCAVLILNLDGFKHVNDSLGHVIGDKLLQDVASRLRQHLRESDNLARIGADEFAFVLRQVAGHPGVERLLQTVERIHAAISARPAIIEGESLNLSAGIGIALYPGDGADAVEIMRSADVALLHAKQAGRNQYQFHTTGMNTRALEIVRLDRELRSALEGSQFVLHYQPQIDIQTGRVCGAQALIRWLHPTRGLVYPGHFISIAEERGLISAIGSWVLEEVCRQNAQWQREGLPAIPVAVNLSALQFHRNNLPRVIAELLKGSSTAPRFLELELTESAVMRDTEDTIVTMRELRAIGVQLSLDDFGTGYSSLSQLKLFPFNKLKVDQSFVQGLPGDSNDHAIVAAIVAMGRSLGLQVIAEGVETSAQWEILRTLGCHEIQGYFVARPLPAAEFMAFVQQRGLHDTRPTG